MIPNGLGKKALDALLGSGTLKCMLLANTYTPDNDAHEFIDDVSANEVSGSGYTAGGATVSNVSTTVDNANDRSAIDADDPVFTEVTLTDVRYAVFYIDTGTPATSPILQVNDLGADQNPSAADLTIQIGANGLMTWTPNAA